MPCQSTVRQIDKSGKIPGQLNHLSFQGDPSGSPTRQNCDHPVADHRAHRRIGEQPLGVIYVLLAGRPSEPPQQAGQPIATVSPVRASTSQQEGRHRIGQSQHLVQLAMSKQPCIGRDRRAAKRSIRWRSKTSLSAPLSLTRRIAHAFPARRASAPRPEVGAALLAEALLELGKEWGKSVVAANENDHIGCLFYHEPRSCNICAPDRRG